MYCTFHYGKTYNFLTFKGSKNLITINKPFTISNQKWYFTQKVFWPAVRRRAWYFWVDFWWFRPQCFVYTYGLWWHCDMYKKKVVFRRTKSVSNCIRALPCCVVCFPTRFFFFKLFLHVSKSQKKNSNLIPGFSPLFSPEVSCLC